MASLFGAPKPLPPRVLPAPPPPPSPAAATAKEEKRKSQTRRGRGGTIATSFRGVLLPQDTLPSRKRLLGE